MAQNTLDLFRFAQTCAYAFEVSSYAKILYNDIVSGVAKIEHTHWRNGKLMPAEPCTMFDYLKGRSAKILRDLGVILGLWDINTKTSSLCGTANDSSRFYLTSTNVAKIAIAVNRKRI